MDDILRRMAPAAVAATLAAGVWPADGATAQETERCYGVALAGENDGVGAEEAPGAATVDYQGDAWVLTPVGTCLTMALPPQPDGTPRRGAFEPLDRDRPR